MLQQLTSPFTNNLATVTVDKDASRSLVNNYLDNYVNQSYPLSGLREFINSHLNIPEFDEICENGTLANSGTFKTADTEVSYKIIDKVQGTTLLSSGNQHFILDNQIWNSFSLEANGDKDQERQMLDGETSRNYKNIGQLRRLIQNRAK
jgi:hypothetical protein